LRAFAGHRHCAAQAVQVSTRYSPDAKTRRCGLGRAAADSGAPGTAQHLEAAPVDDAPGLFDMPTADQLIS
jgi:hypothetical protein